MWKTQVQIRGWSSSTGSFVSLEVYSMYSRCLSAIIDLLLIDLQSSLPPLMPAHYLMFRCRLCLSLSRSYQVSGHKQLYTLLTWLKAEVLIQWHLWTSCVVFTPAYILTVIVKFLTVDFLSDESGIDLIWGWGEKKQCFPVSMIYMWLLTVLPWELPRNNIFMGQFGDFPFIFTWLLCLHNGSQHAHTRSNEQQWERSSSLPCLLAAASSLLCYWRLRSVQSSVFRLTRGLRDGNKRAPFLWKESQAFESWATRVSCQRPCTPALTCVCARQPWAAGRSHAVAGLRTHPVIW